MKNKKAINIIKTKENNKKQNILIIKVGNEDRPAGPEDIKELQNALNKVALDPNLTLVTHHAISFKTIKKSLFDNIEVVGVCHPYDHMKKQFNGVDSIKE